MKSIKGATTSIHGKTVIKSTIVPCIAYKDYVEYIEEYKNPLKAIKINYLKNLSYNWLKEESKKYDVEENKTIDNKHDKLFKDILSGNVGKEAIKKIEEIRERKGGEEEMLNVVRMLKAENAALRKEGYKEGVREQQKIIARNMLSMKMELEKISKITGLSIEEVKLLKEKIS